MTRGLITCLIVATAAAKSSAQDLGRPVGCTDCIGNWFYVDNLAGDGAVEDWNCMQATYDQHRGSDFSLIGGNDAISAGHEVLAAAEGVVRSAQDGFFDRCESCEGSDCDLSVGFGYGNHIIIDHGDRSVVYAHLRMGSLRVAPGELVACGQPIAQIGSSGCSTGAHLHFETRTLGGDSTSASDPFVGSCSPATESAFFDQGPYQSLPLPSCNGGCAAADTPWACNDIGTERVRCAMGMMQSETCSLGCISGGGQDAVCGMPLCNAGMNTEWACAAGERIRCLNGNLEREVCGFGCSMEGTAASCVDPASDRDGDGFANGPDCDDADHLVYPGAMEICGDAIDQDCNGTDEPCPMPIDATMMNQDAGLMPGGVTPTPACAAGRSVGTRVQQPAGIGWAFLALLIFCRLRRGRRRGSSRTTA